MTGQLSERNKVSAYYDYQFTCSSSSYVKDADACRVRGDDWIGVYGFGTWSPEASQKADGPEHIMQFSYTAPMTSKLLLEAAFSQFFSNWSPTSPAGALNYAAVHPGAGAKSGRRRPRAQHGVPRLRRAEQQPPDAQRVARVGSPT